MRNKRSSTLLMFKKLLHKIFIGTKSDLAKQDIKAKTLAVEAATTTATSIGHQLTKMSCNWFCFLNTLHFCRISVGLDLGGLHIKRSKQKGLYYAISFSNSVTVRKVYF